MFLAILLYTGCDCYGDLRASERRRDYNKWRIFSSCLHDAIVNLARALRKKFGPLCDGDEKAYSGLSRVMLSGAQLERDRSMTTPTFTSTSTNRNVGESFMGDEGVLIEFDLREADFPGFADVRWISKLPGEDEVLLDWGIRSIVTGMADQSEGVQYVHALVENYIVSGKPIEAESGPPT